MSNNTRFSPLWDQVLQEDDLKKALTMTIKLAEQAINNRTDEIRELQSTIENLNNIMNTEFKALQKTLYGNGNPSSSIVARLDRIEEQQHKYANNVNKLSWTIITVIITQIVLYILKVL